MISLRSLVVLAALVAAPVLLAACGGGGGYSASGRGARRLLVVELLRVEGALHQLDDLVLAQRVLRLGIAGVRGLAGRVDELEPPARDLVQRILEEGDVPRLLGPLPVERDDDENSSVSVSPASPAGRAAPRIAAVGEERCSTAGRIERRQASWSCSSSRAGGAVRAAGSASPSGPAAVPASRRPGHPPAARREREPPGPCAVPAAPPRAPAPRARSAPRAARAGRRPTRARGLTTRASPSRAQARAGAVGRRPGGDRRARRAGGRSAARRSPGSAGSPAPGAARGPRR